MAGAITVACIATETHVIKIHFQVVFAALLLQLIVEEPNTVHEARARKTEHWGMRKQRNS